MSILSPLNHVIGRKRARTFGQKARDTFEFFSGFPFDSNSSNENGFHAGIFDYLTLGIPTVIQLINLHLLQKVRNRVAEVALWTAFTLITAPLLLARVIFAAVLTFVSLPFIALAQALDQGEKEAPKNAEKVAEEKVEAKVDEKVAEQVKLIEAKVEENIQERVKNEILLQKVNAFKLSKVSGKPTVEKMLNDNGVKLTDISKIEDWQEMRRNKREDWHNLTFFKAGAEKPVAEFRVKLEKPTHREAYDAMCTLNIGNIKHQ